MSPSREATPGRDPVQAARTIDSEASDTDGQALVTVEASADSHADFTVFESFDPAVDVVEIVDADGADLAGQRDDGLFAAYSDRTSATLVYEVAVDGGEYEFEGTTNTNAAKGSLDEPTGGDSVLRTDETRVCPDDAGEETLADGSTVCDVDGDGNYRDVNGDGDVSNGDVVDFFGTQHVDPWDSRTDLFDFDGNDDVGQGDVVALFEYVQSP